MFQCILDRFNDTSHPSTIHLTYELRVKHSKRNPIYTRAQVLLSISRRLKIEIVIFTGVNKGVLSGILTPFWVKLSLSNSWWFYKKGRCKCWAIEEWSWAECSFYLQEPSSDIKKYANRQQFISNKALLSAVSNDFVVCIRNRGLSLSWLSISSVKRLKISSWLLRWICPAMLNSCQNYLCIIVSHTCYCPPNEIRCFAKIESKSILLLLSNHDSDSL